MYNLGMNKPAKFSGEAYGTKLNIEFDHSDLGMDELLHAFKSIAMGLQWGEGQWRNGIMELAEQYQSEIKEESSEDESDNDWDVTLNDGLEDEDDYIENPEWAVVDVINKLKQLEVDGETTQYILEQIGMDEQMAIQLATKYPDVVSEHLAEIKSESLNSKNESKNV